MQRNIKKGEINKMKKERLGSDPFDWIKDSREEEKVEIKEESKQELQSVHSKQNLQDNISNTGKKDLQNIQDLSSPQGITNKLNIKMQEVHNEAIPQRPAKKGLSEGWTRATFIIKEDQLKEIKDYAYWERLQIKDVLEEIIDSFFEKKGNRAKGK
jgi:hypothetical protein